MEADSNSVNHNRNYDDDGVIETIPAELISSSTPHHESSPFVKTSNRELSLSSHGLLSTDSIDLNNEPSTTQQIHTDNQSRINNNVSSGSNNSNKVPKPPFGIQPTPPSVTNTTSGRRMGRRAAVPVSVVDSGGGSISEQPRASKSGWSSGDSTVIESGGVKNTRKVAAAVNGEALKEKRVIPSSVKDTNAIPDLDEDHDDNMSTDLNYNTVATVPLVRKSDRIKTIRQLDLEVANETKGLVTAQPTLMGIDLSLLQNLALMPTETLMEPDVAWDWDVIYTEISSELSLYAGDGKESPLLDKSNIASIKSSIQDVSNTATVGGASSSSSGGMGRRSVPV